MLILATVGFFASTTAIFCGMWAYAMSAEPYPGDLAAHPVVVA